MSPFWEFEWFDQAPLNRAFAITNWNKDRSWVGSRRPPWHGGAFKQHKLRFCQDLWGQRNFDFHLHQVKFGSMALLWGFDFGAGHDQHNAQFFLTSQDTLFIVINKQTKKKKKKSQGLNKMKDGGGVVFCLGAGPANQEARPPWTKLVYRLFPNFINILKLFQNLFFSSWISLQTRQPHKNHVHAHDTSIQSSSGEVKPPREDVFLPSEHEDVLSPSPTSHPPQQPNTQNCKTCSAYFYSLRSVTSYLYSFWWLTWLDQSHSEKGWTQKTLRMLSFLSEEATSWKIHKQATGPSWKQCDVV